MSGGAALFTGGTLALEYSIDKGGGYRVLLIFGGMAIAATSVPFFTTSFSNKYKAKLYMRKEAFQLSPNLKTGIVYNSVGVKINFLADIRSRV